MCIDNIKFVGRDNFFLIITWRHELNERHEWIGDTIPHYPWRVSAYNILVWIYYSFAYWGSDPPRASSNGQIENLEGASAIFALRSHPVTLWTRSGRRMLPATIFRFTGWIDFIVTPLWPLRSLLCKDRVSLYQVHFACKVESSFSNRHIVNVSECMNHVLFPRLQWESYQSLSYRFRIFRLRIYCPMHCFVFLFASLKLKTYFDCARINFFNSAGEAFQPRRCGSGTVLDG